VGLQMQESANFFGSEIVGHCFVEDSTSNVQRPTRNIQLAQ
jgi:hypothetical protein